jgi:anti-anti-sigma factor
MVFPAALSVLFSGEPGVAFVRGELDGATVGTLESALALGDLGDDLQLDLSGLEFVDSVGLAGLLRVRQRAVSRGGQLVVLRPRRNVAKVLAVTGLDVVFGVALSGDEPEHLNDFA